MAKPAFAMSPGLRAQLNAGVSADFPGQPTGAWQTFDVVSDTMAAGGTNAPIVSFPVTSALYEISGGAFGSGGTPELSNLDGFTIQIVMADWTQLNAGDAPLLGTAFFNRLTGIKVLKKPWVIGPNQVITFNLVNVSGADLKVYLGVVVLQLELPTNAVQF